MQYINGRMGVPPGLPGPPHFPLDPFGHLCLRRVLRGLLHRPCSVFLLCLLVVCQTTPSCCNTVVDTTLLPLAAQAPLPSTLHRVARRTLSRHRHLPSPPTAAATPSCVACLRRPSFFQSINVCFCRPMSVLCRSVPFSPASPSLACFPYPCLSRSQHSHRTPWHLLCFIFHVPPNATRPL